MMTKQPSLATTRLAVLALALAVTACATAPATPTAPVVPAAPAVPAVPEKSELDNAPDGTSITIKLGGELKVLLDANAIAGFQWQAQATAGPLLSPIGTGIWISKADPRDVRAGGFNVFRFKAEQPGTATLQFDYKHVSGASVALVKSVRYSVSVAP